MGVRKLGMEAIEARRIQVTNALFLHKFKKKGNEKESLIAWNVFFTK